MIFHKKVIHIFFMILIILIGILIRLKSLTIYPYSSFDFNPLPDALEYFISSQNFLDGHGFSLKISGSYYPSRYTFGWPIIISSFLILAKNTLIIPIIASVFFSISTIPIVYFISHEFFSRKISLLASLLYSLSPVFITVSQYGMSEDISIFLTCLTILLCIQFIKSNEDKNFNKLIQASLLTSFSTIVRYTNYLQICLLIISFIFLKKYFLNFQSIKFYFKLILILFFGSLGLFLVLIYNYNFYGSLLTTGYDFWDANPEDSISFKHFFNNIWIYILYLFTGLNLANDSMFIGLNISSFPMFGLLPLGILGIYQHRFTNSFNSLILTIIPISSLTLFYSLYFFQDVRFLLPSIPCLFPIYSYTIINATNKFLNSQQLRKKLLLLVLLIIIFIPWLTNLEAVFRDKYDYPVNWKLANELSDYANNNFAQDKVNFITGGSLAFYNYFTHDLINIKPISTKQDYAEKIFPNYNLVKNINKSLCASEVVLISNLETQSRYPGNWQVLKSSFKFSKIKEFFSGNLLIYKLEKLPNIACKTTK